MAKANYSIAPPPRFQQPSTNPVARKPSTRRRLPDNEEIETQTSKAHVSRSHHQEIVVESEQEEDDASSPEDQDRYMSNTTQSYVCLQDSDPKTYHSEPDQIKSRAKGKEKAKAASKKSNLREEEGKDQKNSPLFFIN